MARITINERYDGFGRAIRPGTRPFSSKGRKMPDWWIEFGRDLQVHWGELYYKGTKIVEIDNFDPHRIGPTTNPFVIQWSLRMEDGTYTIYKPESAILANILYNSDLWWRNKQ